MAELQALPQPLARLRDALLGKLQGARAEHALGFVAFEATVRWLALCLLRARATLEAPLDELDRVKGFLQRPGFGSWMELLLRYGERAPEEVDPEAPALSVLGGIGELMGTPSMPAGRLRDALRDRSWSDHATIHEVPWRALFSLLPAYRNDFIGHTGYLGEEHYERYSPLIRSAALSLLAHPALGKLRLESRNGTIIDLSLPARGGGSGASTGGMHDGGALALVSPETGEPVLALGPLAHLKDGSVYLFDRSPRRGGIEYLEFATGDRVRTEGSILTGGLAHALSFESRPGSEKWAVRGRVEVYFQPLRWSAGVGAHVPFRAVLRNHGPVKAVCELSLESAGGEWTLPASTRVEIEPAGMVRVLLWAGVGMPGIVETPKLRVKSELEGDRPAVSHAASRATVSVAAGGPLPMVGRDEILSRLKQHLQGIGLEPGSAALITGEPGSGKSTLLGMVLDRAGKLGVRALRVAGAGVDSEPLHFFHDLLRELLGIGGVTDDDDALRLEARERLSEYLGDESPAISHFVAFLLGDPVEAASPGMRGPTAAWSGVRPGTGASPENIIIRGSVHSVP